LDALGSKTLVNGDAGYPTIEFTAFFVFRMTSSWKLTRLSSDPLKGVPFLITNTITMHLTFSRCSEVGDVVAHCGAGFLCVMRCVQTNQLRRAQRTASRKGDYSPRVGDNGFLNSRSRMRMWTSGGWGRSEQRRVIISGAHGTGRPGTTSCFPARPILHGTSMS
jgi:hypothetical protein